MTTATLKLDSVSLPRVNWKIVFSAGLVAMFALLVFYVLQINELTKGSYLISSYQNKIGALSETNKNLEVSFAENSFMGQAVAKAEGMNFQKTTSVKYIQVSDASVAIK